MIRFLNLLRRDALAIVILLCYALTAGLLGLAVPLAAQALVNTIAQGLFWQPLLVLSGAVLAGLLLSGLLKILQFALAESVQQHLFERLGMRLTEWLPRFQFGPFLAKNGPEELNKFFEVVNIQKSWNKILLDVPTGLVELILSFCFLTLYGPTLMVWAGALWLLATFIILVLGYGGLSSSLKESHAKYELAGWLEQMARCHDSVKLSGNPQHFLDKAHQHILHYLRYRKKHFWVLFRQISTYYVLQSILGAGVLGLGGWLVMQRELSLGQLVAAEIVILNLLKACEKLVKAIDSYFDLATGLEKLEHLLETPQESPGQLTLTRPEGPLQLDFREVSFAYTGPILERATLRVGPGERVSVVAEEGGGRTTLARLAVGLLRPDRGQVELQGMDLSRLSQVDRGRALAWLTAREELFDTTVEENITLGRDVSSHDLRWVLELSGLHEHLPWLAEGLATRVTCGGRNLSRAQVVRVLLARNLLIRPQLLIIDQEFSALDFEKRRQTVRRLFDPQRRWSVLNLVPDVNSLALSDRIYWLRQGQLEDLGSPQAVLEAVDSPFQQRFPTLVGCLKEAL